MKTLTSTENTKRICRKVYRETNDFSRAVSIQLGTRYAGYQILYGPPHFGPPILFIGYQPGRGEKTPEEERKHGSEKRWPKRNEYVTECWPLAVNLRAMLGRDLLEKCVASNAIFFRANSVEDYKKCFSLKLRREIQEFCVCRIKKMIDEIKPGCIVALGFATQEILTEKNFESDIRDAKPVKNSKGRTLVKYGRFHGRDVLGILHPSGCRISKDDRARIKSEIKGKISSN